MINKWINVKDELPPINTLVWISDGEYINLGERWQYKDKWLWYAATEAPYTLKIKKTGEIRICAECDMDDVDVKFWQYLPKPPGVQNER